MLSESSCIYSFALNRFASALCFLLFLALPISAQPTHSFTNTRKGSLSSREEPISTSSLKDKNYLPAQIGAIVGAYAVSLVLVALTLVALSKKRREHLEAGNEELEFEGDTKSLPVGPPPPLGIDTNVGLPSFTYTSPTQSEFNPPAPYVFPSPTSSVGQPGVDLKVDQRIVAADRVMAQTQLEDMYKYVMEHEEAKQRGIILDAPVMPGSASQVQNSRASTNSGRSTLGKKEKNKPANLNLSAANEKKTQSRTSSLFSALRSPRKKGMKGVSISSPIMTPQSGAFPRPEVQELSTIPPRQYAPLPPPPPVPVDQVPYGAARNKAPMTPDMSPESVQSIDERIGSQLPLYQHSRNYSQAPTEADPESATSEHSQVPLVGLPSSPKPGARFPSLPASPKPGATFQRSNAPSAVRTGGALPLRAYEPAMSSPTTMTQTTKQTVFERKAPMTPGGAMTPFTANAVPYSPYQPYTPCVPMTPSLVTKEDRKRMKRMVPKTPTLAMVQSSDDVW